LGKIEQVREGVHVSELRDPASTGRRVDVIMVTLASSSTMMVMDMRSLVVTVVRTAEEKGWEMNDALNFVVTGKVGNVDEGKNAVSFMREMAFVLIGRMGDANVVNIASSRMRTMMKVLY